MTIINHSACRPATMLAALSLLQKCLDIYSGGPNSPFFYRERERESVCVCVCSYCIQFPNDATLQPRRMAVTAYTLLLANCRVFVGL